MAATSKAELLSITQKEYSKLKALISAVSVKDARRKDDEDTSIKDVIGHRAHWIDLFLGWYADGLAGKQVHFPAEGYKWNELRRYNAELRQKQARLSWGEAVTALDQAEEKLNALIQSCSDTELYGDPMKGAHNNWTVGRWAEAAGPSHFRSAAKYVRSRLKSI